MQFWGFSVLQRHGVLLPGGDFFHGVFPSEDQQQQQQKFLQQQAEKVARIHSSSKREKKQPKASFHHLFLWVSQVTLGIFGMPFWSFSVLQRHGVFPSGVQQRQQKSLQKQEVSEVTLGIFGVQF